MKRTPLKLAIQEPIKKVRKPARNLDSLVKKTKIYPENTYLTFLFILAPRGSKLRMPSPILLNFLGLKMITGWDRFPKMVKQMAKFSSDLVNAHADRVSEIQPDIKVLVFNARYSTNLKFQKFLERYQQEVTEYHPRTIGYDIQCLSYEEYL